MPVYCSRASISVAMTARRFGYSSVHGHDVEVEVCVESRSLIDLSALSAAVERAASRFDHKPLWETLCVEDPLLEHLASAVLLRAVGELGSDYAGAWAEARVPEGRIKVSLDEARRLIGEGALC